MFGPLVDRLLRHCRHGDSVASGWRSMLTTPAELAIALPGLGHVLYMPMPCVDACAPFDPHGVIVEAPALAPLLRITRLVVASAVTIEGPREWVDGLDSRGRTCARWQLLPDTDYLAWDAWLADAACPGSASKHWLRHPRPVGAQLLRFHTQRLAGLHILGAEIAPSVSALSRRLAAQIARAESVALFPASPA